MLRSQSLDLTAGLHVRQRCRHQPGELLQSVLHSRRQGLPVGRAGELTPHLPADHDRDRDGRSQPELCSQLTVAFGAIVIHPKRSGGAPDPVREGAWLDPDSLTGLRRTPRRCLDHLIPVAVVTSEGHRDSAEQPGGLQRDRGEDLLRRPPEDDELGNGAQRSMLVRERFDTHQLGRSLLSCGDRGLHDVCDRRQPTPCVAWQPAVAGSCPEPAPHLFAMPDRDPDCQLVQVDGRIAAPGDELGLATVDAGLEQGG